MYLERVGTRDITFLETPATDLLGASVEQSIESSRTSMAPAPKADVLWIESLFAPDVVTHQVRHTPLAGSASLNVTAAAQIIPLTNQTDYLYPVYSATYYIFGYTVTDTMELIEKTTYPNDTASQTIVAHLGVDYVDYNESNGTDLAQSAWQVGGNGPAGVKLTCPNGSSQRIKWESIAGILEQSGSWTVNWSFSPAWRYFTLNFSYGYGGTVSLGSGANQDTNGSYIADVYTASGQYMTSTSDYLAANWTAPAYGSPQNVTDTVDYVYDMYNSLQGGNGTDHGTFHDSQTFQTYAD